MAAKADFKRELGEFYAARRSPAIVEVPELAFVMIDGHGDSNTSGEYRDAVSALFSVSYAARFALKRTGVIDFAVMPLEGCGGRVTCRRSGSVTSRRGIG